MTVPAGTGMAWERARPVQPFNPDLPLAGVAYPGGQMGAPIEVVRDLTSRQKRVNGFEFIIPVAAAGTRLPRIVVDNLGDAKIFLGLFMASTSGGAGSVFSLEIATLMINNEIIFQDIPLVGLQSTIFTQEYISFPRPLAGQDEIFIDITLTAAVLVACPGKVGIFYL